MSESGRLLRAAEALIPGGVNSPLRAFRGVGGEPLKQRRLVLHRVRRDDRQAIPSAHRCAMNLSRTAPSDD